MTRCFIALSLCALLFQPAAAQDAKKEAKKKAPTAKKKVSKPKPKAVLDYEATRKEYDRLDRKIRDVVNKYRAARNQKEEQRVLLIEYRSLVTKIRAHFPKLRDAAIKAYDAAPNEHPAVTNVMLGIAHDHIRKDRFVEAKKLLDKMIAKKCDHKAIHPFAGRIAYCLNDFDNAAKHYDAAKKQKVQLDFEDQAFYKDIPDAKKRWKRELALQAKEKKAGNLPIVTIKTDIGEIVAVLYENEAPETVGNFIALAEKKEPFYNGLLFHRVISGFMAQTGCPNTRGGKELAPWGTGGPDYNIYCECVKKNHRHHFRGSISMAKGLPKDTGGSQFFITFRRTAHLDGKHTVFGRVIKGMDIVGNIQRNDGARGRPLKPTKIISVKITNKRKGSVYKPHKVAPPSLPDKKKADGKKKKGDAKKSDKK